MLIPPAGAVSDAIMGHRRGGRCPCLAALGSAGAARCSPPLERPFALLPWPRRDLAAGEKLTPRQRRIALRDACPRTQPLRECPIVEELEGKRESGRRMSR